MMMHAAQTIFENLPTPAAMPSRNARQHIPALRPFRESPIDNSRIAAALANPADWRKGRSSRLRVAEFQSATIEKHGRQLFVPALERNPLVQTAEQLPSWRSRPGIRTGCPKSGHQNSSKRTKP